MLQMAESVEERASKKFIDKVEFNMTILNDQVLLDHIKKDLEEIEHSVREYESNVVQKIENLKAIEKGLIKEIENYKRDKNTRLRRIYEIMNES